MRSSLFSTTHFFWGFHERSSEDRLCKSQSGYLYHAHWCLSHPWSLCNCSPAYLNLHLEHANCAPCKPHDWHASHQSAADNDSASRSSAFPYLASTVSVTSTCIHTEKVHFWQASFPDECSQRRFDQFLSLTCLHLTRFGWTEPIATAWLTSGAGRTADAFKFEDSTWKAIADSLGSCSLLVNPRLQASAS